VGLTEREAWLMVHLMLGAVFVHSFAGGLGALAGSGQESPRRRLWLRLGTWGMTAAAWLTVVTGTWILYPWYRAKPPAGADPGAYPRSYLLAHPEIAGWHTFAMEWKEHVGWLSPILATAVAYVAIRCGSRLFAQPDLRRTLTALFVLAFLSAAVAAVLGAFINKVAPNSFLDL
jgi:hypothetical protein